MDNNKWCITEFKTANPVYYFKFTFLHVAKDGHFIGIVFVLQKTIKLLLFCLHDDLNSNTTILLLICSNKETSSILNWYAEKYLAI